jgi:hypothetical protein
VLKGSLNNDGHHAQEVVVHYLKEEIGYHPIGVWRELIMFDAKGVDIALFDFITAYDGHP